MNLHPEPSETEIFAASDDPFTTDGNFFAGVDAFGVGGPVPAVGSPWPRPTAASVSCVHVQRSVSVYLDGELTWALHTAVQAHLAGCPPCERARAFQAQLRATVASGALDPMPADARARIVKALGL